MIPYADSNFFSRLYFELDDGSAEVASLMRAVSRGSAERLPITRLHRLEVMNALEMHVFQARQLGQSQVTREAAAVAQATFREDCAAAVAVRSAEPAQREVDRVYEELVLRHTASRGFRTYDLLHVAQALALECDAFWSFDAKANVLAALEGLKIRRVARGK